ncbi:hypothetical protein KKP06_22050 [Ralstonia pickettii]|uniref:hypothetical protein n=1 Tax=Ralstonia pickettii TaxID=329 RepID=UPI001BE4AC4B|nr:hypothetical protein [Ralstonia pickettii]MBT2180502.1 hypothetical protein [Ralstonia pickettii]
MDLQKRVEEWTTDATKSAKALPFNIGAGLAPLLFRLGALLLDICRAIERKEQ